jgi:membrane protease YdiL (CAAX protease family)
VNWETPKQIRAFHLTVVVALVVILNLIVVNIPDQAQYAQTYFLLLAMVSIVLALSKTPVDRIRSWGANWGVMRKAFLSGGFAMLGISLLKLQNFTIGVPLSLSTGFGVFFLVIVAAVAEEFVFREVLPVSFGDSLFSNALSQLLFGLYHIFAYTSFALARGVPLESLVFSAVLFGIAATALNQLLKSSAAGLGMHMTNNLLAYTGIGL